MKGAIVYLIAAMAGAAVSALALGIIGGLARSLHGDRPWVTGTVFAAVAAVAWVHQFRPQVIRLPQNTRLIPQHVPNFGPVRGAAQFGFEMGTGARTYVTAASPYILAAWLALYAMPWTMLIVAAAGFGIGRGLPNFYHLRGRDVTAGGIDHISRLSDVAASAGLIALVVYGLTM